MKKSKNKAVAIGPTQIKIAGDAKELGKMISEAARRTILEEQQRMLMRPSIIARMMPPTKPLPRWRRTVNSVGKYLTTLGKALIGKDLHEEE